MPRRPSALGLLALTFSAPLHAQDPSQDPSQDSSAPARLLTLEQTARRDERVTFGASPPKWRFAPDGVHLVRGRGDEARWIHPETWEEREPPPEERGGEAPERDALVAAFEAVEGVDHDLAERIARARASSSEDGRASLRELDGRLWFHRDDAGAKLLAQRGGCELAELSPDGGKACFVRANDLWSVDTSTGEERRLTTSGGSTLLNGKLDWVYQEEVYGRGRFRAFWWSPDSTRVAFLSLDVSKVPEFPIVDAHGAGFDPRLELERFPKPGDPNPVARLGVVAAAGGDVRWIDLARYDEHEPLIVRVGWQGDSIITSVQDRVQSWLELLRADPDTGEATHLLREAPDTWIRRGPEPRWLADGSFLWVTERSGHAHLEHRAPSGELLRELTRGEWNVERILEVDEERGLVWVLGDGEGAVNQDLYRVGLDGQGLRRLTSGAGRHRVRLREDRALFLDEVSSLDAPPSVRLCDGDGTVLKELGTAEIPALAEYRTSRWELLEIPTRDGLTLDAAILKPAPFDPERVYPVWLPTYSGPNSPSVRNSWRGDAWDQFLAQQGVIIFQVNVRTASGKGQWAIGQCHRRLGAQELADLEDAVRWLTTHPWADASRVGIGGRSYGGFMTAYALTHSELFALGIAGSGVYDWRLYDSLYTECFMDLPRDNAEGYEQSSVIAAAADLHGHLVLTHGTLDDNVHVQNTLRLAHALQEAGKDFELMLYPRSRHRVGDPRLAWHLRKLEWRAIREHLRPPGPTPAR